LRLSIDLPPVSRPTHAIDHVAPVIGEVRKMQPGIGAGVSGNRSAVRQRFASADMLLELIYPYRHLRKARRLGGSGT